MKNTIIPFLIFMISLGFTSQSCKREAENSRQEVTHKSPETTKISSTKKDTKS